MKMKKTSMAALLVALALVVCVTTGFATSAQATSSKTADEKTTDISPNVAQVTGESTVTSYTDPKDGKTYYSWDSGTTWTPMTDEEFDAVSTPSDVEWWTAEEYAAWLEEEKEALRSMIGERGWTPSTGWFTWNQQMVDETIALYEQTLKDIQNGMKISKPTSDGDAMLMFGYDPRAIEATAEPAYASTEGDIQSGGQRAETDFVWPVPGAAAVSAGYETRVGVDAGVFHSGVDIPAPKGTAVAAACSGTVTAAGWDNGGGNCVEISHGDGYSTVYRHLSEIQVEIGQEIACGQQIGTVGSTGRSTGPHLHFEICSNGEAIDPMQFF